jgi:trehalose synthase-fused probable maltokinase
MTPQYRRVRYESMVHLWKDTSQLLTLRRATLASPIQHQLDMLFKRERDIITAFRVLLDVQDAGLRIRCHGDYHLGQVLYTGSDYVITDFEGEPARPLSERRTKHSPLYDVAGMLRSFDYASWAGLARQRVKGRERQLEPWTAYWSRWVRAEFLQAYLTHICDAHFWPRSQKTVSALLKVYQLEKAVYELSYELNNRPEWVVIPLNGIEEILHMSAALDAA